MTYSPIEVINELRSSEPSMSKAVRGLTTLSRLAILSIIGYGFLFYLYFKKGELSHSYFEFAIILFFLLTSGIASYISAKYLRKGESRGIVFGKSSLILISVALFWASVQQFILVSKAGEYISQYSDWYRVGSVIWMIGGLVAFLGGVVTIFGFRYVGRLGTSVVPPKK